MLGTHCVDNSPTPEAAKRFVSTLPGVGEERADDVVAYEFMADFRVHAALRGSRRGDGEAAYMTSLRRSACRRSRRAASLVLTTRTASPTWSWVIWGPPSMPVKTDDDGAFPMVTVRNAKGRRMLDTAVASGRVGDPQRGGAGGRELPSIGLNAINNSEDRARGFHGQDFARARLRRRGPGRAAVRREYSRGRRCENARRQVSSCTLLDRLPLYPEPALLRRPHGESGYSSRAVVRSRDLQHPTRTKSEKRVRRRRPRRSGIWFSGAVAR